MRIAMTGAGGFIGRNLRKELQRAGHEVIPFVRHLSEEGIFWDPKRKILSPNALEGIDLFINLAGEPIYGRWNEEKREKIFSSRIDSTVLLVQTLHKLKSPPKLLLSASAVGYYGHGGEEILTESSHGASDFLARVCKQWEEEALKAPPATRVVLLRFGVVLSEEGGALKKMGALFRRGLGARLGSGQQYMSWIALQDLLRAVDHLIQSDLSGPFNLCSPLPVTNAEFTKILAHHYHKSTLFSLPPLLLEVALGQGAESLLHSTRAIPQRLLESGFSFQYPELKEFMSQLKTSRQ